LRKDIKAQSNENENTSVTLRFNNFSDFNIF